MAREPIEIGEYYHIYNRGVDKRLIVQDKSESNRFLESLIYLNSVKPIGSIKDLKNSEGKPHLSRGWTPGSKLVEFVAYCLNPNHYHLILKEIVEGGISEFMKRLSGGYTLYFNEKNERSGALFQGKYKYVHISNNTQLKHVSTYVNLNYKVHRISKKNLDLVKSSWREYLGDQEKAGLCTGKQVVLEQFRSPGDYRKFAKEALERIIKGREEKVETIISDQQLLE